MGVHVYIQIYMHVITLITKRLQSLKRVKEGIWESFEGGKGSKILSNYIVIPKTLR